MNEEVEVYKSKHSGELEHLEDAESRDKEA